jgi:hypothetical protein
MNSGWNYQAKVPRMHPFRGGRGGSGDPAYDFAGSKINIGLPTALDDAGYAYLDDLKTSGQLTVQEMALVQHEFYNQQVALSPAFKAVLSIAIGNFVAPGLVGGLLPANAPAWMISATESFASNLMMGGIEGVVSGNFNLGQILEGATFSAISAGLSAGININLPQGEAPLIAGFGSSQLTLSGLVNAGLDGAITSGLSSAVYGTDFSAGVVDALTRAVVAGVAGAAIQEVADIYGHDTAALEKTIAKATVNCLAAQANGASCASAALGRLVVDLSLHNGLIFGAEDTADLRNRLELAAAVAGFFVSEGEAENVYAAANAAVLDVDNNDFSAISVGVVLLMNEQKADCLAAGGPASDCQQLAMQVGMDFYSGMGDAAFAQSALIIDFIPIVGDFKGAYDCVSSPTPATCGGAFLGIVPMVGDAAKILLRKGDKVIVLTKQGGDFIGAAPATADEIKLLPPPTATGSARRYEPGVASYGGNLPTIREGDIWLRGSDRNAGKVPSQIAEQLAGKEFRDFDHFREEFWKAAANDPVLSRQFGADSLREMKLGRAPYAARTQQQGGRIKYELDHSQELQNGGNVYDMNNIVIRTPLNHIAGK